MKKKRMSVSEVKDSLSSIIEEANARGDIVIITRRGRDVARLTPIGAGKYVRRGNATGRFTEQPRNKGTHKSVRRETTASRGSGARPTTWEDLNTVAERIRKHWPEGVSAEDALNDIRG